MTDFHAPSPEELVANIMRSVGITEPTEEHQVAFMMLVKFLMQEDPSLLRFPIADHEGNRGELVITEAMPACTECGKNDGDYAYQDLRFADGNVLCEFCFTAHSLEWERTRDADTA